MTGSEIIDLKELNYIKKIFNKSNPPVLYRYHPNAFMVKNFERIFSSKFNVKYSHLLSSGTAAIETALFAAGVRPGDEVITTAFTFLAPVEAILKLKAIPVCVEIDQSLHMDPIAIENAITKKTKAICVVPMWGPCDMEKIVKICKKNKIKLVEDTCQCMGGTYKNKLLGTFGIASSFSLDYGKTITAGEAGVVVTNNKKIYELASAFADHGHKHDPNFPRGQDPVIVPGFNYRVSEITGAVALAQLEKIGFILKSQRKRYHKLINKISNLKNIEIRKTSDREGDTGDTLIIIFPNNKMANLASKYLKQKKINSKILPEAFNWHFAGSWKHIWKDLGYNKYTNLKNYWPNTFSLLKRSVAVNISVHKNNIWDEMFYNCISKASKF